MTKATVKVQKKSRIVLSKSSEEFSLCNKGSIESAVKLANFLRNASINKYVLYGHQNDQHMKAGSRSKRFSSSDTYDICKHFAAVNGFDALCLTGNEFGKWYWTLEDRINALVKYAEKVVKNGSILSLSAHMPNFDFIFKRLNSNSEKIINEDGSLSDGSINFSGYTPIVLEGNVVQEVMPGKKLNEIYKSYLNMIADFCLELQKKSVSLIWRPFHENTGGWFWWGKNTCTAEEYIALWQYTWNYFVKEKNVNNLIWAYSPGSEPKTLAEFDERYPGDDYVDLIGFDMYQHLPEQKDNFFSEFKSQLKLVSDFALLHKKLFACTETGVANPNNKALLETGNEDKDWYKKVLSLCSEYGACYFLLWANFSSRGAYYSPYVEKKKGLLVKRIYGHELLDSFIKMYNDSRSIFSKINLD
ncbi:MAG: glycosyl hydrolase [Treponema sp.]